MKVLLINSPIRLSAKPNCLPTGLAVIASVLIEQGHDVEVYDINALRHSEPEIEQILQGKTWDMAGVSGLITTCKFQKWIIDTLKKLRPEAPVVSGGGFATSVPDFLFEYTDADIAVIGEGEQTMAELCLAVEKGVGLKGIPGIWYREQGPVRKNPGRKNMDDLDRYPFPAWRLFPVEIYLENPIWGDVANNSSGFRKDITIRRSMNIISSRGCPFSCNYCYHLFGRSSYRFRSAENIIAEMEILVEQYGVDFIGFVDDNMMASEKRLKEFCRLLMEKPWKVFWGCHGRVSSADPGILNLMAESGCVWIGYGIESGSQTILDAMNKKTTVETAKKAIIETRKAGIYPNTTFIYGYPGETVKTIRETIAFKKDLGMDCGSFFATPYPGTELYDSIRSRITDEKSFIESLGDATSYTVNLTGFDDRTLVLLKQAYDMKIDFNPDFNQMA